MIRLSISEQGQPPRLVTFNKSAIVVGRTDASELCLTGKGLSTQHCRISSGPQGLQIEDLGSTNGTYVNRVRISGPTLITAADEIVIAVYVVRALAESGINTSPGEVSSGGPQRTGSIPLQGTGGLSSGARPANVGSSSGQVPTQTASMPGPLSSTGAMPVGAAFDDARWVREWERLDKLATEWIAAKRDRSRLLRADKLAHARRWLAQGRGRQPLPKREHSEFIQASASAARLRIVRNVTIVSLVLGLGGVAAWRLMPEPVPTELDAVAGSGGEVVAPLPPEVVVEPTADPAQLDAAVAKATSLIAAEPDLAALLALRALGGLPSEGDPRGTSAEQVLRRALQNHRGQPLRGHDSALTSVAMSPDGRWVASVAGGAESSVAYLWDLERPGLAKPQKLRGGQIGAIRTIAFAPDGTSVIVAGDDEELSRWDLRETPPALKTITAPDGGTVALGWSGDGRWLVAGGRSGRARVFDLSQPSPKGSALEGHTGSITAVDINAAGTRVVTASQDGTAMVFRLAAGVQTAKPTKLEGHMGAVQDVALSPDGRWVITGGADTLAKLWDLNVRVPVPRDFTAHTESVDHVAFTRDGRLALTAGADDVVTVWKLTVAQPELAGLSDRRSKGKGDITALWVGGPSLSDPDRAQRSTWAVMGAADGSVRTLDPSKIDKTIDGNEIPAHTAGRVVLGVDTKGAFAASGGADAVVRAWDLAERESGGLSKVGRGHAGAVVDLALNVSGTRVLTGGADGNARLWEVSDRARLREIAVMPVHKGKVQVAISPDGRYGATASEDGIVRLWPADGAGPELAHKDYPGHTAEVNELVFGPDGTVLVSVSNDKTARVWRMTEDPAKDVVVIVQEDLVKHAAVGPQSRWLITATIGQLNLWDLHKPNPAQQTLPLEGHESDIRCVAISPDGRWAASGDANDRVVLWDLSTGDVKQRRLKAHTESVNALAFSSDGRWLASAGRDRRVLVWRLTSKHPEDDPITLEGHASGIGQLAWSADGKWLYSGDNAGAVRAWPVDRADPAAEVMVLDGHTNVLSGLAVVGDGSAFATTSYDGAVRIWPLHPEGLREVACAMIGRDLTDDEWSTHVGGKPKTVCD